MKLTDQELMHLHNMVHEIYSGIMMAYTMKCKGMDISENKDALRMKGYISCGLLMKLIREVHDRGLCKDPSCVKTAENVYENFFKQERETDEWWAKRVSTLGQGTAQSSPQSDSSSWLFAEDESKRRPE